MQARINNPVMVIPEAMQALQALAAALTKTGVPVSTLDLINLRASQINGCSVCVALHVKEMRQRGETDQRMFAVATWRETPYFTEAERAVLALTEAATRLSDRSDAVPDAVWDEVARHYNEAQLAAITLGIANINAWNRVNATTRQIVGDWAALDRAA